MDIVRSIMSNTSLPLFLWGEALKKCILNKVSSKAVQRTPFDLWTNRKPSLNHVHIWGCPTEVRIFNPYEKILDPRTISCFFNGNSKRNKGYRLYCPNHITWIVKTGNTKFLENGSDSRSIASWMMVFEEQRIDLPLLSMVKGVELSHNHVSHDEMKSPLNQPPNEETIITENTHQGNSGTLRQSQRLYRSTISNDYIMYLQEHKFDIRIKEDPITFLQAIESKDNIQWINAMKDELESMHKNEIWDLVELLEWSKPIGCKCVFKTKWDSKGKIERHNAKLDIKGFTQKKWIDYREHSLLYPEKTLSKSSSSSFWFKVTSNGCKNGFLE